MISVTEPKSFDEIQKSLGVSKRVYIIGCGTCPTQLHTGGKPEVLDIKAKLEGAGRDVTGWMVIPTACDSLTEDALKESVGEIEKADAILVLSCAYGVQTVASHAEKLTVPALNTLFVGKEGEVGELVELCTQCGECVLGFTAGICPVTQCAKGLLDGPCGGSSGGKCEVSGDTPCAWQSIHDRLAKLGLLGRLAQIQPPKDWSKSLSGGPRRRLVPGAPKSAPSPAGKG